MTTHHKVCCTMRFARSAAKVCSAVSALLIAATTLCADNLVELANPLQGTDSIFKFSHGNLYPAIALPFPMNAWAPYTQPIPDSFYYQYRQSKFRGVRQTHQPSPWMNEYAAFSVMPVAGELKTKDTDRASDFSHDEEVARPSYYSAQLPTHDAKLEVTPTERCASFRVTYGAKSPAYLVVDAFPKGSTIRVLPKERKIIGVTRYNHGGIPKNFGNYFVIRFDQPIKSFGVWTPDKTQRGQDALEADHVGAYVEFDAADVKRPITFRTASSYINHEQAERTLQREIGDDAFDATLAKAEARWNDILGRIEVAGGTPEQRRTFYSAFYRSMLFPHKFYEIGDNGQPRYYSPYDGKIHEGVMYTDSGLWDTFRAVHPLFNLVFPEVNAEILQGMLSAYDQSNWLPAWSSPGHRDCMIGNHAFSLFADAWAKGNRSFDAKKALEAIVHNAAHEGPIKTIGREGVDDYNRLGYLPSGDYGEAAAKTLEFAYDDWCASVLARDLGETEIADKFAEASNNWRNVFDPEVGFVRGRKKDGTWLDRFSPDEWGGPFTEGSSWHWTWCVFHDIVGLIDAIGGRDAFARKLDEVFAVPPTVETGSYGGLIHEMTEMIAINMGQYAHGNQPIQHMIYLYVHAGQPWKAQQRVREVMDKLYNSSPTGLCGDEDNGQTSAWYVFSAMGFYPVTPGRPSYIMGSPLFERMTLNLPGDKKFVIDARGNGPGQVYIQSAALNGAPLNRAWLEHEEVANGGKLELQMGPEPNRTWATAAEALPPQ